MLDELERAVVGKRTVLTQLLTGIFASGHILFEDVPGLAKTLIARSIAQVAELEFSRVQFTPDLVPADITGSAVFDVGGGEGVFKPGPVFANLVLGDEINRAPPKTQSAVLEAMEERQVTVDGVSHQLPAPFIVIATQNPIESGGTYPLPEAQLDRFLLRLSVGYPDLDAETEIITRRADRGREQIELDQVIDAPTLRSLQRVVETVPVEESVARYMASICAATRETPRTDAGASPRGSLALLRASRAWAALDGRNFVTPDDVHAVAVAALAHRLILKPDEWLRGVTGADIVTSMLATVPTPASIA
ncbi:MAG: MoxR family ATPase [Actinomycetota bacterium]